MSLKMEEVWTTADECSEDYVKVVQMQEEIIALRANVRELSRKLKWAEEDKTALREELRTARENECRCETNGTQMPRIALADERVWKEEDHDDSSSDDDSKTCIIERATRTIEVVTFSNSPNAQSRDLSSDSDIDASHQLPLSFPAPLIPNVNREMDNSVDMDEEDVYYVSDAITQTEEVAGPVVNPTENSEQFSSEEANLPNLVQQATTSATEESRKEEPCKNGNGSNTPWHCVECGLKFEFFEDIKLHAKTMHGFQKLSLICFGESPDETKKETKKRKPHPKTANTKPPNTRAKRGAAADGGCGTKRQKSLNKDH